MHDGPAALQRDDAFVLEPVQDARGALARRAGEPRDVHRAADHLDVALARALGLPRLDLAEQRGGHAPGHGCQRVLEQPLVRRPQPVGQADRDAERRLGVAAQDRHHLRRPRARRPRVGSTASTVADRRSPLNSASSPTTLPGPSLASVTRRPSGKRRTTFTAPVCSR